MMVVRIYLFISRHLVRWVIKKIKVINKLFLRDQKVCLNLNFSITWCLLAKRKAIWIQSGNAIQ